MYMQVAWVYLNDMYEYAYAVLHSLGQWPEALQTEYKADHWWGLSLPVRVSPEQYRLPLVAATPSQGPELNLGRTAAIF